MVIEAAQILTELAGFIFDFRAFRPLMLIEAMHRFRLLQIPIDPFKHGVGQLRITDQLIAIVAVFIMLMQVNIVQAGAAVEQRIVNNKAFEMQYAQCFAGIDRDAVNRNRDIGILARHLAIPVRIGHAFSVTDAAALCPVPVHQHADIQRWPRAFGGVERGQDGAPGVIIFQIECHDADALRRAGDLLQQRSAKLGW